MFLFAPAIQPASQGLCVSLDEIRLLNSLDSPHRFVCAVAVAAAADADTAACASAAYGKYKCRENVRRFGKRPRGLRSLPQGLPQRHSPNRPSDFLGFPLCVLHVPLAAGPDSSAAAAALVVAAIVSSHTSCNQTHNRGALNAKFVQV